MINLFYIGRSPGFASISDFLPMRMHSGYNHRQLNSCGDSVGIVPNFPIKLHIVVPTQNEHNILFFDNFKCTILYIKSKSRNKSSSI